MRARYLIGVFTGSIIFGGFAYASYQMDSAQFINQDPQAFKEQKISTMKLNLAEQAEEYPTRNITGIAPTAQKPFKLAKLNLFSSKSQQQNNNQSSAPTNNSTHGQQANSTAASDQATPEQQVEPKVTETENMMPEKTEAVKQPQVSETYIPADSNQVAVDLPKKDKADVAPETTTRPTYYQRPSQRVTQSAQSYEHNSFRTVPTPVYFSSGSIYNPKPEADEGSDIDAAADTDDKTNAQPNPAPAAPQQAPSPQAQVVPQN